MLSTFQSYGKEPVEKKDEHSRERESWKIASVGLPRVLGCQHTGGGLGGKERGIYFLQGNR